jgi:hypothetical protein
MVIGNTKRGDHKCCLSPFGLLDSQTRACGGSVRLGLGKYWYWESRDTRHLTFIPALEIEGLEKVLNMDNGWARNLKADTGRPL